MGIYELQLPPTGQRLAPERLVVATERWAVGIRVFSLRGVSVEVELGVYLAAQSWSVPAYASCR